MGSQIEHVRFIFLGLFSICLACAPRLSESTIARHPPLRPNTKGTKIVKSSEAQRPAWLSQAKASEGTLLFIGRGTAKNRKTAQARARRDFDAKVATFAGLKVRSSFSSTQVHKSKGEQVEEHFKARSERRAQRSQLLKIVPQASYWEALEAGDGRRVEAYAMAEVPKGALEAIRLQARFFRARKGRAVVTVDLGDDPIARSTVRELVSASAAHPDFFVVSLKSYPQASEDAVLRIEGKLLRRDRAIELSYRLRAKTKEALLHERWRGTIEQVFKMQASFRDAMLKVLSERGAMARQR